MKPSILEIMDETEIKRILEKADNLLTTEPVHITDTVTSLSPGGIHDYYSNGDYWWPNPNTVDGLPYIRRDGQTNLANFTAHRTALQQMRFTVTYLAMAYKLTGHASYAHTAAQWLKEFFLDQKTAMLPHLTYAQAIPGVCQGRGIGIIDTLHLIDVPQAIDTIRKEIPESVYMGLRNWFHEYLTWMNTHPQGIEEREWENNHSVTWFAQASSFARFTEDDVMLSYCRKRYRESLLPKQMAEDGSFPKEIARTKPYSYSCFVLDNMVNICLLASTDKENLWNYELPDGRSIRKGIEFMHPFIVDKSNWPYGMDIEHYEVWPVAMPYLLFAGLQFQDEELINLWNTLDKNPNNEEVKRNIAIRCAYLFLNYVE